MHDRWIGAQDIAHNAVIWVWYMLQPIRPAHHGLPCLIETLIVFAQSYSLRITSTTKNGTNLAILDRPNCIAVLPLDTNQAALLFGEASLIHGADTILVDANADRV
jgi:hypothetical protein